MQIDAEVARHDGVKIQVKCEPERYRSQEHGPSDAFVRIVDVKDLLQRISLTIDRDFEKRAIPHQQHDRRRDRQQEERVSQPLVLGVNLHHLE